MAINEMDARLISQGTQVESVGAEALIPVASGEGQPQSNITLANFADSLGQAVPQQQDAEQVTMTGLYAQTSDGKMVELTKESVAKVMEGLITKYNPIEISNVQDLNDLIGSSNFATTYFCAPSTVPANMPPGMNSSDRFFIQINRVGNEIWQKLMPRTGIFCYERTRQPTGEWNPWQRLDNFGANTKEELASMVAEQMCCTSYKGFHLGKTSSVTVNFSPNNIPRRYACIVVVRFTSPGLGAFTFVASGYGVSSSRNSVNIISSPIDSISVTFADDLEGFVISNSSNSEAVIDMLQFGENISSPTLT